MILILFSLLPVFSYADLFNNRNLLMGNRAALMGGAYTALSEDLSGAYYNPAGLAFLNHDRINLNAAVYSLLTGSRTDPSSGVELSLKRFAAIPTSLGNSYKLTDDIAFALSIFQIDNVSTNSVGISSNKYIKIEASGNSFMIGPSLAYKFSKKFSVGISIFLHYAERNLTLSSNISGNQSSIGSSEDSLGLAPLIGIKYHVTDKFKLGLTYSVETIPLTGNRTYYYDTGTGVSDGATIKGDIRLPHRFALGLAFDKKNDYTIALDLLYSLPMSFYSPNELFRASDSSYYHKEKASFNFSLGGEMFFSDSYALDLGIFTNLSSATENDASNEVDMFGASIGLRFVGKKISAGLGAVFQYGESSTKYSSAIPYFGSTGSSWKRFTVNFMLGASTKL